LVKRGHTPLRTCFLCRVKQPKAALRRLGLDPERAVVLDPRQRLPGRGAYVCGGCLALIKWDRRLQRVFRQQATGLKLDQRLSAHGRGFKVRGPVPGSLLPALHTSLPSSEKGELKWRA